MSASFHRCLLVFFVLGLTAPLGAATVPETAADNDMDPCFSSDGWVNSVGSYDCITPPGFVAHAFLVPPDGNHYGGGVQYSGVPGEQETIEKTYTNLTVGQTYIVEWSVMTDVVTSSPTAAEAWFEVSLCADQKDSLRLTPADRRVWFHEQHTFTANATSCALRFRARNTTGDNASWIFLDGVAIRTAAVSDLSIVKTGPAVLPATMSAATYWFTVVNYGPDVTGGTVEVEDVLPIGVEVNGGGAGPVSLGGAGAADWMCSSDANTPQTVTCTSFAALLVGVPSTFHVTTEVTSGAGSRLVNRARIAPSPGSETFDPGPDNDTSATITCRGGGFCLYTVTDQNQLAAVNTDRTGCPVRIVGTTADADGTVRRIRGLAFDAIADVLYGMTREGDLVTVDRQTGGTSPVLLPSLVGEFWSALAIDPATRFLYTVDAFVDQNLVEIAPAVPASTVQGSTSPFQILGLAFYPATAPAMPPGSNGVHPAPGVLYGSNRSNQNIVVVNQSTGAVSFPMGMLPMGVADPQAITFHPITGELYSLHDEATTSTFAALATYDFDTALATEQCALPFDIVEPGGFGWGGLTFAPGRNCGLLIFSDGFESGDTSPWPLTVP